jgi:ABC-type multidrug transport system fused ATPase/permease subunit
LSESSLPLDRWTFRLLRPYQKGLLALLAVSTAEVALRIALPWALKAVVDHVFGSAPPPAWLQTTATAVATEFQHEPRVSLLLTVVVLGLVAHLTHHGVMLAQSRITGGLSQRLTGDMRRSLFVHLQRLALAEHARRPAADAVYRLTADAGWLDQLVLRAIIPSLFSILTLIVMCTVLVHISPTLALVSVSVVPGLFLSLRMHGRSVRGEVDRVKSLESRMMEQAHESFATIRLVKSFGRETYERKRFSGVARVATSARNGLRRRESRFSFVVGALTAAGTSLVLAVGGSLVLHGTISAGTLLLVLAYLGFVYGPLTALSNSTSVVRDAVASARRVRDVFALKPEPIAVAGAPPLPTLKGAVQFENVSFAYEIGRDVVRSVSFDVAPGELVAIVGPSGSGRTTLASLITRLNEPTRGRILLDGIDTKACSLTSLREQVSVVLQDAVLMSGTIRDNLRYGRLSATDDEIENAARAANAHEFITELPDGYDTDLGVNGDRLSGGQRQRLNIARAFLKDAPILILDEPTSALDTVSESRFVETLERLRRNRTTFVIAHRLSTVKGADRILVMEAGALMASGTHDGLVANCPLYARLAGDFADSKAYRIAV